MRLERPDDFNSVFDENGNFKFDEYVTKCDQSNGLKMHVPYKSTYQKPLHKCGQ